MAIRFRCRRCQQLLGIASRKVGTQIVCPECGFAQTVPPEPAPSLPVAAADGPPGTILYRRRTLYVHGLLFLLLGAGALAGGYVIGRSDAIRDAGHARGSVPVEGRAHYDTADKSTAPDIGTVVIALPADKRPRTALPIEGLRPRDPPPTPSSQSVRKIEQFGGACARTDELGAFTINLPKEGRYRVLLISRQTTRDQRAGIDQLDLAQMSEYFHGPEALIGPQKYRWALENLTAESGPMEHNFGQSGR